MYVREVAFQLPGDPPEKGVPEVGGETPPLPELPAGLPIPPANILLLGDTEEEEKGGGVVQSPGSAGDEGPLEKAGGLILFSFCLLDQQYKMGYAF